MTDAFDLEKELQLIRQNKRNQPYIAPNVPNPNENNEPWYDTLARYLGLAGIGAANMVNNTAVGGTGQLLGLLGRGIEAISPWSGDTQRELRNQLIMAGVPLDEARRLTPYQDSWITSAAKGTLDARNYAADQINQWRNEAIKNVPTDENGELPLGEQIAEGTGSSLGFMLTGLGAGNLAKLAGLGAKGAALTAAGAMGTSEALSESGGLLGEAHRQGLYDEGLTTANKSLAANMLLNSALNASFGRFAPWMENIRNPFSRFATQTVAEVANELLQEPSQHVIEQAAQRDLYNGEDFLPALAEEARYWSDVAGKLAPSVAGSAAITQGLLGGLGMANPNIRRNVMDEYRNRHVDIPQAKNNLQSEYARQFRLRQHQADIQEDIDRLPIPLSANDADLATQRQNLRKGRRFYNEQLQASNRKIDSLADSLKPDEMPFTTPPDNVESRTARDLKTKIEAETQNWKNLLAELRKLETYDTDQATLEAQRLKIQEAGLRIYDLNRAYSNAMKGIYSDTTTTTQEAQQGEQTYSPNSQNLIFNHFPKGRNNTAKVTPNGNNIDSQFAIVEAGRITPSHNPTNGQPNMNYSISQAQNRNRSSEASIQNVRKMAGNLDSSFIGDSPTLQDGAPLVTADGQVIAGNKRAMAIQLAYVLSDKSSAQNYRQFLVQHAQDFGLQPDYVSKLNNPMLVRVLNSNADLAQIQSIGNESNYSNTEAFSASEAAVDDVRKLDQRFWADFLPDKPIDHPDNNQAVSDFFRNIPDAQRTAFIQPNGRLSDAGLQRIKAALQAYAYGNSSIITRLQEMLDSEDREKNITRALESSAPKLASLQRLFAQDEQTKNDFDIASDIAQALEVMNTARNSNQSVASMTASRDLDQSGSILQNFSENAIAIAQFFEKNKRNPSHISAFLSAYADYVLNQGGSNQGSLFGRNSKPDFLNNAMANADEDYARNLEALRQQQEQNTQQDNQSMNSPQDARIHVKNARENQRTQQAIKQESGLFEAYTDEQKKTRITPRQSTEGASSLNEGWAYVPQQKTNEQVSHRPNPAGNLEGYEATETTQPEITKNRTGQQLISQDNQGTRQVGDFRVDRNGLLVQFPRNSEVDSQGVSAEPEIFRADKNNRTTSIHQEAQQEQETLSSKPNIHSVQNSQQSSLDNQGQGKTGNFRVDRNGLLAQFPRNNAQQQQAQSAEFQRHVEAVKSILRDLYNNSNGEKQFDVKPIHDYFNSQGVDKSTADAVLKALEQQGVGYLQDDLTFFSPDKDFPSGAFFNISNPDNLAPKVASTLDNSKQAQPQKQRNVPKTRFTLPDGRIIEFRVQSKNNDLGQFNPRSHNASDNASQDGYIGDFTITHAHHDTNARMYLGQQDGKPIIGITDDNGNFLGHYDPINDSFTAYDEKNGLARLAEAELKRQFLPDLDANPTPAQILDEAIRRDFQQKADDAGRNSTEAESISRVFMKQLEYLSKWGKKSAWDIYKALNIQIVQHENSIEGKKRGETIFGETETIINLFKDADASTLLHETGHIFLHTLEKMYSAGLFNGKKGKGNRAALDWGVISREYGLSDIDFSKPLTQADRAKLHNAHEQFAASLERYFYDGKAPVGNNSKLRHVFDSFKRWLGNIYQAARDIMFTDAKGRKKPVILHRDIRELFDRIFADSNYKPRSSSSELDLSGDNESFLQSERGERGGFFKWLKNLGRKAAQGLASIAHVPQNSSGANYSEGTLLSPETIRRITEASKPLPRGNIVVRAWQGAKKIAQSVTGGDFSHITNAPDAKERGLLPALEFLRQGQRNKKKAVDDALRTFRDNLKGLNKKQLDLFNVYRILDDLMFQIHDMPNSALPFGLDEKTLRAEHARLSPIVKADSQVASAIQAEEDTMRQYSSDYQKYGGLLGLDFARLFRNPHYYRHQILDYAQAVRNGRFNPSSMGNIDIQGYADSTLAEIMGHGWHKKRKGSTLDFLTDYIRANSEVRLQMAQDVENMKTLLLLKKEFDIAPKLLERLKQRRKNNQATTSDTESYSQSDTDEATSIWDVMTDEEKKKYQLFDPAGTRLLEANNSASENLFRMSADDIAQQTGIPLDKILLAWGLDDSSEDRLIALPNEVVESLRDLARKRHRGLLGQAAKDITTWWKRSVLFSPFRNLKYNIRNFSGDLDALIAGNPRALKQLPQAFKELTAHYLKGKQEGYSIPKSLKEYIDRSAGLGIQSLNLSAKDAQAILNMLQDMQSPSKTKKAWNTAMKPIRAFFSAEHSFTEWREHLLRYAAYLDYKQQMEENQDGKPNNWGASIEDEVMSIDDIRDRAFKMSNELLGAYDQVSETGKQLRDMLVPFYSWIEVNMRRYARLFKNAAKGGNTKNLLGQIMLGKTAAIPAYAVSASMAFGQLALFTLATQLFNRLVWPDADDDLPNDVKYRPHITLGKNGNDVYYFDRIGALADVLDWASLDSIALDAKDFKNGQKSLADWFKQILQAPVSKAVNSLNPGIKLPIELAMGRSMFPNVFKPSTIKDPAGYLARSFGLSWPYKAASGIPHDTIQELTNLGLYSLDADEAAYFQTLDRVRQFQNTVLDKHFDGFATTQRGRILQKIKSALRYNDNQALRAFLREYAQADGSKKGLQQSMKAMHPLHGLSKKEQEQFLRWISPDDRKYLRKAERYFRQLTARFIK